MTTFSPENRKLSVSIPIAEGGGVVEGELVSLVQCPRCNARVRWMTVFENADIAMSAAKVVATQGHIPVNAAGRGVVAGTGMSAHQKGGSRSSSYGYPYSYDACSLKPFVGTEADLLRTIWCRLHKPRATAEVIDALPVDVPELPVRQFDVTRLGDVTLVEDIVNPEGQKLLMVREGYLRDPKDLIVSSWNTREEKYDDWAARRDRASQIFLETVSL